VAIIKLGPVVQAISGTIGDTNFVNAARTVYVRKGRRATSSVRRAQLNQQQTMNTVARAWVALTTNQRNGWTTAAKNFPHKNKLGVPTTLSGREFFFLRNLFNLSSLGVVFGALESTPPIMTMSPEITTLILTNPNSTTINLQVIQPAPIGPLPVQYLWVSRTYSTFRPRVFPRWTPFCTYASFVDTFNIRPYMLGTPGLFGQTSNPAVGAPSVTEWIAVKAIGRLTTMLDTQPVVATLQVAL
jgi:hypothetical protein